MKRNVKSKFSLRGKLFHVSKKDTGLSRRDERHWKEFRTPDIPSRLKISMFHFISILKYLR